MKYLANLRDKCDCCQEEMLLGASPMRVTRGARIYLFCNQDCLRKWDDDPRAQNAHMDQKNDRHSAILREREKLCV